MIGLRRWLPLLGAASIVAIGCAAWPFTIDDAFILGRYARRIATGEGYTMIAGPATDGVTGPLALVPGLFGQLGWGDPVLASKLTGLVATALAVALVVARAARESVARGSMVLLVAVSGATLGIWSVAGLETGLATLALTVAALAVTGRTGRRDEDGLREARGPAASGVVAGIAIAALAWLRPELALASGVLLSSLWREDRRAGWVALGLALAGAVAVVAFRVALFGSPLPLSAQAKPADLANGASYVARGALVALGGGGLLAAFLAAREGRRMERVLVAAIGAHLLALLLAGGDWMPGFRLLAPVIPIYALAVSGPIASRLRAHRGRALALLAACVLIPSIDLAVELPRARDAGRARETAGRALAAELAAHAQRVAMVDVGYLAYRSRVEVIDLGGVTDPSIGALPGAHLDKRIDPGVLRARSPDTIVLHSSVPPRVDERGRLRWLAAYPVEERVARMPWVVAEMRVARVVRYSPEYFYVVLRRPADDAR